jgi:hypothetical protein
LHLVFLSSPYWRRPVGRVSTRPSAPEHLRFRAVEWRSQNRGKRERRPPQAIVCRTDRIANPGEGLASFRWTYVEVQGIMPP